ncbi:MAG: redoxin domain-containing protein, partial [Alphaproteobacteria bacterium]
MIDDASNSKPIADARAESVARALPVSKALLGFLGASLLLLILAVVHFGAPVVEVPIQSQNDYGKMLAGRPYWTYDATPRAIPDLALTDASGATHHLSDFKGHYVIVNIWETNCYATPQVLPGMNNLPTHFSDDQLKIVNLAEDRGGINTVQAYY